ncbi:hypothetical protein ACNKG6_19785 [Acinetobacter baumannii]
MLKDYLGPAAEHKHKAEQAIKKRDLMMLGVILMSKNKLFQHAKQCNFTESKLWGRCGCAHHNGQFTEKRR